MWRSPTKTKKDGSREGMDSPLLQRVNEFVESFHTAATADSDLYAEGDGEEEAGAGIGAGEAEVAMSVNPSAHGGSSNTSAEELRAMRAASLEEGGEIEDSEAA
eukprot:CAMPEP_0173455624 /NCGR_PEP_ID=MMETSP1357-20121228/54595_1 /TAXON_ID=77926 /ORGANISM="Hemiselmis rufescens, Strain PCC563" /LENGTH=103 /DNA_ID=CAMNT_0014422777 /DNA_START=159 /DNA_END=466 /DNA_ORIENTATION=-